MTDAILTFHGDVAGKALRVQECRDDIFEDRLIAGTYELGRLGGEKFMGCSIGCQTYRIARRKGIDLHELLRGKTRHEAVADDYGWPVWLCYLEDIIFEGLPLEERQAWHLRLIQSVPVGVDVGAVKHLFLVYILNEVLAKTFDASKYPDAMTTVAAVSALHKRAASGDMPTDDEWIETRTSEDILPSRATGVPGATGAARSAGYSNGHTAAARCDLIAATGDMATKCESATAEAAQAAAQGCVVTYSTVCYATYDEMADKLVYLLEATEPGGA